ncbi:MAG: T9SS type A sorting domain-containing protein [Bacteroidetes bacterium]|nr:T9SS type A sorting domain-containing protein [Bacteroidota bacterium]
MILNTDGIYMLTLLAILLAKFEFKYRLSLFSDFSSDHSASSAMITKSFSYVWDDASSTWQQSSRADYYYSPKSVDVEEVQNSAQVRTYPNPFSNALYFEVPDLNSFFTEIYNGEGKMVWSGMANQNQGIDLSELQNGVYIYKVYSVKDVFVGKIIK